MANPSKKDCATAFKKLQDYLPDGTHVQVDFVKNAHQVGQETEFYQITGGYVIEKDGQKAFDPSTLFILVCLEPPVVVLPKHDKIFKMKSFEGAIEWLIESFKVGGFNIESPEIVQSIA